MLIPECSRFPAAAVRPERKTPRHTVCLCAEAEILRGATQLRPFDFASDALTRIPMICAARITGADPVAPYLTPGIPAVCSEAPSGAHSPPRPAPPSHYQRFPLPCPAGGYSSPSLVCSEAKIIMHPFRNNVNMLIVFALYFRFSPFSSILPQFSFRSTRPSV